MKKTVLFCLFFMATGVLFASDKVKIVTTLTDLASLAEAVGGDKVDVYALAKGSQDPHKIEVLPSYMMKLRKADLFILVGILKRGVSILSCLSSFSNWTITGHSRSIYT